MAYMTTYRLVQRCEDLLLSDLWKTWEAYLMLKRAGFPCRWSKSFKHGVPLFGPPASSPLRHVPRLIFVSTHRRSCRVIPSHSCVVFSPTSRLNESICMNSGPAGLRAALSIQKRGIALGEEFRAKALMSSSVQPRMRRVLLKPVANRSHLE